MHRAVLFCAVATVVFCHGKTRAEDWPTWRADAGRSGSTSEQLPAPLHRHWTMQLPKLSPAWAEDPRLQFDANYEPIVVGERLFLSSSATDSVTAYDLNTGDQLWRFYAEGPVRFAPVAARGKLFFGADDGSFYCLAAETGKIVWRFRAAPSERRVIGNARLASVWPMRGGPVVRGDRVYFTVGVWPFEGAMLYSLDITTGEAGPDGAPSFTSSTLEDQAPQGYLSISDGKLFIPCGRANVLPIDLAVGKRLSLRYSSKGLTDYHAVASDRWLFHGSKIVDVKENRVLPTNARRPVVRDGVAYFVSGMKAVAYDLANQDTVEKKDRRGKVTKSSTPRKVWSLDTRPVDQVHALAGSHLYASFHKKLVAIAFGGPEDAKVAWDVELSARPTSVVAANRRLLVATSDGALHCFGGEAKTAAEIEETYANPREDAAARAEDILAASKATSGYGVVFGLQSEGMVEQLIAKSNLHIIAVDPNAERVAALRERLDALGWYGSRCTAVAATQQSIQLPPYLANLVYLDAAATQGVDTIDSVKRVFQIIRPYGGAACFETDQASHGAMMKRFADAGLANIGAKRVNEATVLRRVGPLPGSADWTHEFGDPANTLMSREKRVKAPLGVLWFGGPASDGKLFYDRHQWGPSMAVQDGRMFIQGPDNFTAVDVYTGRILWKNIISNGRSPGRGSNWGPTGYHFVATSDLIYLTFPQKCELIDPETGKLLRTLMLPEEKTDYWGRIRIVGNRLFAPVFRRRDGAFAPEELIVMDRTSGKVLWRKRTEMSFPLMAIGNGKIFCYEGMLEGLYVGNSKIRVRGAPKAGPILNVKAFDIETGDELWTRSTPRAASWLAYSEKDDVLLVSNKQGIDAWQGKSGDELWTKQSEGKGFRGHPENYWDKVIIWNGQVLDQRGPGKSYDIKTGKPILTASPFTDEQTPWEFTKIGHHCNYAIASEHLMTFRAASAGFLDLTTGGTSRLEGFRSGCRNSLIPANGVLNAPNFAHGCTCSYSIFTSLALVHVPESDLWSYGVKETIKGRVKRLGVNFAAPGDRRASDRTVWLNYPPTRGSSTNIRIQVGGKPASFRLHSAQIDGDGPNWVAASGMRGVASVRVPLVLGGEPEAAKGRYRVRLHFAEPKQPSAGENVFDVAIGGTTVLSKFDIASETQRAKTSIVKQFDNIEAGNELLIEFTAHHGQSLINGIEIQALD